jgi:gamma-glutamyltranspeptidase/glutathione hydrolase/leukotriene-C4 hydrolase
LGDYTQYAVASDNPYCSKIGKEILDKGGSVVDAAISTGLCNGVAHCHNRLDPFI